MHSILEYVLWFEGVIGPYFFEDDDGAIVAVNSERYNHMMTNFYWPAIEEYDTQLERIYYK